MVAYSKLSSPCWARGCTMLGDALIGTITEIFKNGVHKGTHIQTVFSWPNSQDAWLYCFLDQMNYGICLIDDGIPLKNPFPDGVPLNAISDIDRARNQLKLGIALLRGRVCIQSFKYATWDATTLRNGLKENGFTKMVDILSIWIGKAINKGDFL